MQRIEFTIDERLVTLSKIEYEVLRTRLEFIKYDELSKKRTSKSREEESFYNERRNLLKANQRAEEQYRTKFINYVW